MAKKVNVTPADFSTYFKGLDLKKRISVMETAKTLLELQEGNETLLALADAPPSQNEGKKRG
jgi:hypothetical protein